MNYKDLENISYLSQQILTEAASEEHDVMNRWPYSSPYLQEARDGYGDDSKFKQDIDADSFRPGKDVPPVKKFGRISRATPHGIGAHANRTQSRVTTIVGDDSGAARAVKMAKDNKKLVKKDGKWVKAEELEYWVNSLLDEGYDLSDYTWNEMLEMYIMEGEQPLPTSRMAKQARRKAFDAASETHSDETGIGLVSRDDPTARQLRTMARVGGPKVKKHIKKGYAQGRNYDPYYQELNSRNPSRNKYDEGYDFYDLVLAHLIDEGYTDTIDGANAIMANMSEEWVLGILDEVKGFGGHVDPNTGKSSGLRSPSQQAHTTHWRNRQQGEVVPDPRRSKFKSGGSKGSTTGHHQGEPPEDFAQNQDPDLAMTPAARMRARATALRSRGEGKRANKIDAVRNRPNMSGEN